MKLPERWLFQRIADGNALVSEAKNAEQVDGDPEAVYHCLVHLANNGEAQMSMGKTPAEDYFQL